MQHSSKEIIKKIDVGLKLYSDYKVNNNYNYDTVSLQSYVQLHSVLSNLIYDFSPQGSAYQRNFLDIYKNRDLDNHEKIWNDVRRLYGLLLGLKTAYQNDLLESIEQEIRADVFNDFLEMAEFFLLQGDLYKHPAAFLIGGVLEEHLRKLAIKNGIDLTKENGKYRQAEDLNIDLRKKEVYNDNERKSITAWLGLRNDADHAHWTSYSIEKVEVMLKDVRRIVNQYPA
jgi:hypothetical protein